MLEINQDLLSKSVKETLCSFSSGLSREQDILVDHMKEDILTNIPQYAKMPDFSDPVKPVDALFLKRAANCSKSDQLVLRRALVAKLALHLPVIVERLSLPASILALYPDAFDRLADFLKSTISEPYDLTNDFFRKDIRFVLGLTVPCGTFVVDLFSRVHLRTILLSFLRSGDVTTIIRYLNIRGYGPWLHMHIEQRYLTELNEKAHDRMYMRIAELLKGRRDVRGTTGSSWLYDPQLLKIGTRHAYIRLRPLERGAFFLKHGQGNVEQATVSSKSRRRLYDEGKYVPIEYSMLWPRKELIAWAEQAHQNF